MIERLKSIWVARFAMAAALISLAGGGLLGPVDFWFIANILSALMSGTSLFLNWIDKRKRLEVKNG